MGKKWIKILNDGNIAFKEEQYAVASWHYTKVMEEFEKHIRNLTSLSNANIDIVIDFCLCCRLAGKATLKNGRLKEAEEIYLKANEALIPVISNLNNRLKYRALTLTQFKKIFYDLADLYVSNGQMDKLETFLKLYQPKLLMWARDVMMVRKEDIGMN